MVWSLVAPVVVRLARAADFLGLVNSKWPYRLIARCAPAVKPLWKDCELMIMRVFTYAAPRSFEILRLRCLCALHSPSQNAPHLCGLPDALASGRQRNVILRELVGDLCQGGALS